MPIVLEGETGTGKELATRALHRWSGRSGPLSAVNCAALPEGLAEGELFGYRRGAFTGADRASAGFFRGADGGTLLLDEVSDLPLGLQAKLLRVLEEREVQPLGEISPGADRRAVVVAGQQPLIEAVRAGRFRADLLARLDGLAVRLPPLRERREDVLPLFSRCWRSSGRGAPRDGERFRRAALHARLAVQRARAGAAGEAPPDPARQRRHAARAASARTDCRYGGRRRRAGASRRPTGAEVVRRPNVRPPGGAPEPVELPALVVALRASGGNVARAAAMLGSAASAPIA